MEQLDKNQVSGTSSVSYIEEQILMLKAMLSYALDLHQNEIKISFPTLENFYILNQVYKSSWAIFTQKERIPKLLYTGNFLIQGGNFNKRSSKSPFGAEALSKLTSIANTFSVEASVFKQNWTMDLDLYDERADKLNFSLKEYQDFLKILNTVRAKWLLHLSEEGNFDFVISEFSEPTDSVFFMDLEKFDSQATKIKTYFKPISQQCLNLFQTLSIDTEFEGKFVNLQPGIWLKDDVLIEMEKSSSEKFFKDKQFNLQMEYSEHAFNNPFKSKVMKPAV